MRTPPPDLSEQQRDAARERSGFVRRARMLDKQKIKNRELDARAVLLNPPEYWEKGRLVDLLLAIPAVGTTKCEKLLRQQQISPSKRLGGMTDAQRQRLVEALGRYYPSERNL